MIDYSTVESTGQTGLFCKIELIELAFNNKQVLPTGDQRFLHVVRCHLMAALSRRLRLKPTNSTASSLQFLKKNPAVEHVV